MNLKRILKCGEVRCEVIHQSYFLEYAALLLPLSPGYSTVLSLSLSVSCVTCPLSMQFWSVLSSQLLRSQFEGYLLLLNNVVGHIS